MRRLFGLLLVATTLGCSPVYVYKAWRGHSRLMSARRPIAELLADPATAAPVRERLELVSAIRRFAFERMAIPASKNYTRFVKIDGEAASWVVTGSKKTAFEAKTWWFPFVGRVPYLGYFDRASAAREAGKLERAGLDSWVGGVRAYSTLRWYEDPVLSTMIDGPAGDVAELLLHELTHTAVFFSSQVDFNEALATYFGEAGAEEFLALRFGPSSAELEEYKRQRDEEAERSRLLDELYGELAKLYASPATEAEKLERRRPVFDGYRQRLGAPVLNNAVVMGHRRYRFDLSDFRRAHERVGRDWGKLLEVLKGLDRARPREALRAWLEKAS